MPEDKIKEIREKVIYPTPTNIKIEITTKTKKKEEQVTNFKIVDSTKSLNNLKVKISASFQNEPRAFSKIESRNETIERIMRLLGNRYHLQQIKEGVQINEKAHVFFEKDEETITIKLWYKAVEGEFGKDAFDLIVRIKEQIEKIYRHFLY